MKKVILKLKWNEDKIKQKAMKTVSGLTGVESISIDSKDKKLTIVGDIDAVKVVEKLRKLCHTELVSVGPAKEAEKPKEESKIEGDPNQIMKAWQDYYSSLQYNHYQYAQHVPAYAYPSW